MLNEEVIDKLVERIVSRITITNLRIIRQIGESINKLGALTPSKANQLVNMMKYGGDYNKIVKELQKTTKLNAKEIDEIFQEVAESDYRFAKKFYQYRNIGYIPFDENYALKEAVEVVKRTALKEFINLSNTRMLGYGLKDKKGNIVFKALKEAYYDIIDEVVLSNVQGKETVSEVLKRTIESVGQSGLKVIYPSTYIGKDGKEHHRVRRLDSAVRMNIYDGINKVHNKTQEIIGEQFGADGIEVTAHINPAKDHELLQGKQFSFEEYDKLNKGLEAKTYDGMIIPADKRRRPVSTLNCMHTEYRIVLGISKPRYTNEELQKIRDDNDKGFTYEGKHYTNYEGTQLQRQIELKIRQERDKVEMAKSSNDPDIQAIEQQANQKIKILKKKRRELDVLIYGGK